ncbi:unnamed protein product [Oppiella nova]|uniref:Uncharacterized protein n=1 Tax=Oppiella nova TaxID=334625 RepID=A0A7R9M1C9_9ACAR|nr:unnamed protein product [Oppiella nova]CAG2168398.1 unnamed protein product [Oppiella nova]
MFSISCASIALCGLLILGTTGAKHDLMDILSPNENTRNSIKRNACYTRHTDPSEQCLYGREPDARELSVISLALCGLLLPGVTCVEHNLINILTPNANTRNDLERDACLGRNRPDARKCLYKRAPDAHELAGKSRTYLCCVAAIYSDCLLSTATNQDTRDKLETNSCLSKVTPDARKCLFTWAPGAKDLSPKNRLYDCCVADVYTECLLSTAVKLG